MTSESVTTMRISFLLGAVVMIAVALAGCSDRNPPISSSGGTSSTPPPRADGGKPPGSDGGAGPADAAAMDCSKAVQRGSAVQEIAMVGKNETPAGGTIASGSYVLKEIYTGLPVGTEPVEALTEYFAQKTLTLDMEAGTYLMIAAEGQGAVGPAVVSGGTFSVTGSELVLTNTCPGGSDRTYGFTAAGLAVILFNGTHQELFFP